MNQKQLAVTGALACFCIVILFPLFAPYSPLQMHASAALSPPSDRHLLGTDALGRDVLSRFLHGGQRTLLITGISLLVALAFGILLGTISGGFGGVIDGAVLIVLNTLLALPGLLLALIAITQLGQGGIAVGIAVGIAQIAPVGQVTRTAVRTVRSEQYVIAAVAIGATKHYLLFRTVLSNALPTIIAYASITFAYCLLNVAAFGYLGLIGTPELPEWGRMLAEGREVYREALWVSIAPGIALTFLVISSNALADKLSQINPRG